MEFLSFIYLEYSAKKKFDLFFHYFLDIVIASWLN